MKREATLNPRWATQSLTGDNNDRTGHILSEREAL